MREQWKQAKRKQDGHEKFDLFIQNEENQFQINQLKGKLRPMKRGQRKNIATYDSTEEALDSKRALVYRG